MVKLLPPKTVERLRAGESIVHPQQARSTYLKPEQQPYAYPRIMSKAGASCRSCGKRIYGGETVLAASLFLEGTPLNARRPTTVYLHPHDCWADPATRPLGYESAAHLYQEHRKTLDAERKALRLKHLEEKRKRWAGWGYPG